MGRKKRNLIFNLKPQKLNELWLRINKPIIKVKQNKNKFITKNLQKHPKFL
jgi:hypothetical protein